MEFIDKKLNEELNMGIEESTFEMASIGQFMQKVGDSQNKTGFKVFVTNDSRPLSHIHIVQKDGIKKKVCVEFSNPPKYFKHDGYEDSFSKEEAEEFNNFLSSPYKYSQVFLMGSLKFNVKTYWDYCIYQWKLENDGYIDNLHLETDKDGFVLFPKQPNYSILGQGETPMEFIKKEINEQLNREIERPAFEMATTLREATLRIMDRADSFLEHFFKVVFYINDINQNKWRNGMAARITECGKLKNTSTNKKFDIKVYNLLFTTLCSNPEELSEQSEPIYRDFLQEGFSEIELNKVDFNDLYTKIRGIADKSLVLMTDKKIYGREDYRKIIDEVL